jgi:zinc transport system ATP-binding protein
MSLNPVEVAGLRFQYGTQPVLDDVSFVLRPGSYTGIIGPNGGGKTTLVQLLLGLLKPDAGDILLYGTPVSRYARRYEIGYVPQRILQDELRFPATVGEVVASGRYPLKGLFNRFDAADRAAVREAMEVADVLPLEAQLIGELSGGQRQRVFIARALAASPKMLILDEPVAGVDLSAQERFYGFLRHLNRDHGLTILLISHDIDVVQQEVDRVLCLQCSVLCHVDAPDFEKDAYLRQVYGDHARYVRHDHFHTHDHA